MIVYPEGWEKIGQQIGHEEIGDMILKVLWGIPCASLAFSGGLDSSLLLYFMAKIHEEVMAFTIGLSDEHPDIINSRLLAEKHSNVNHKIYIPTKNQIEKEKRTDGFEGDNAVRLFYKFVSKYTDEIISGDGLDEFMCGYYSHRNSLGERAYYNLIRRLQEEHLIPLDNNSRQVRVYLPYLDDRLVSIFSQIPIQEKVDRKERKKIINLIAKGKIPDEIINRRKYGFCDSFRIKKSEL